MTINFTVSPSFPNERISDWYIFNTWLQRALSLPIHLELYDSFGTQRAAIAEGKVDIIYANPFDASLLVREKGFRAIARPEGQPDEMVVITAVGSPHHSSWTMSRKRGSSSAMLDLKLVTCDTADCLPALPRVEIIAAWRCCASIFSADLLSARQSPKVTNQVCSRPGWYGSLMFSCISFQLPGMRWRL